MTTFAPDTTDWPLVAEAWEAYYAVRDKNTKVYEDAVTEAQRIYDATVDEALKVLISVREEPQKAYDAVKEHGK